MFLAKHVTETYKAAKMAKETERRESPLVIATGRFKGREALGQRALAHLRDKNWRKQCNKSGCDTSLTCHLQPAHIRSRSGLRHDSPRWGARLGGTGSRLCSNRTCHIKHAFNYRRPIQKTLYIVAKRENINCIVWQHTLTYSPCLYMVKSETDVSTSDTQIIARSSNDK